MPSLGGPRPSGVGGANAASSPGQGSPSKGSKGPVIPPNPPVPQDFIQVWSTVCMPLPEMIRAQTNRTWSCVQGNVPSHFYSLFITVAISCNVVSFFFFLKKTFLRHFCTGVDVHSIRVTHAGRTLVGTHRKHSMTELEAG